MPINAKYFQIFDLELGSYFVPARHIVHRFVISSILNFPNNAAT